MGPQTKIAKPEDLAQHVYQYFLEEEYAEFPPLKILVEIFECLFYASLHTEEGQHVSVTITMYDPSKPIPRVLPRLRIPERWSYFPFKERISFDVGNVVKLAKAADPWSSTIAIYYDESEKLWIYGMIDQVIHQQSYLNLEDDSRPEQPGIFQVSISGIGALTVMNGFELIATLKQNVLIVKFLNVFKSGPVSEIMKDVSGNLDIEVAEKTSRTVEGDEIKDYLMASNQVFRNTVSRILNRIKAYKHGGALLITENPLDLDIKYQLKYDRISSAIVRHRVNAIINRFESRDFDESYDELNEERFRVLKVEKERITKELKGAIRFVASQSCVDGLILMNKKAIIQGFGAVIKDIPFPKEVYVSSTIIASGRSLATRQTDIYGTRHRAMFAYCGKNPGSLGFVISQDGDIRAVTLVNGKLVMWENIQIQKNVKRTGVIEGP